MTLYKGRERFRGLSVRIGIAFARLRLSPNQWTALSLVPILIALHFLVREQFLLAALFFMISGFLDLVDGSVARVTGQVTRLGAYLDTVVDRYVEGIIIFGLLFASLPHWVFPVQAWIFLYFFGSLMTTYAKAAAREKGLVEKELRGGLMERAERLMILFIGMLLAHFGRIYLTWIIALLAVLANVSALQRIWIAARGDRE